MQQEEAVARLTTAQEELVSRRHQDEQDQEDLRRTRALLAEREEELQLHQEMCRKIGAEVITLKDRLHKDELKLLAYQDKLTGLEATTQRLTAELQQQPPPPPTDQIAAVEAI